MRPTLRRNPELPETSQPTRPGSRQRGPGGWTAIVVNLTVLPFLVACTNVIQPPQRPLLRPSPVYVLDHGRHASLVLPAGDSLVVRYAYGDWRYYAQRETGVFEASTAVLLPTAAGLGRRELRGTASREAVRRAVGTGIEAVHEVMVEERAIRRLRTRLDYVFEDALDTRIYNSAYGLEFVRHPEPYTIFRNSNRMVAVWLRQLGCDVRGLLLFSRWRVRAD